YQEPNYQSQPYHTLALSGQAWVEGLMSGHPDQIFNELGMQLHVFLSFVANLQLLCEFNTSQKGVTVLVEEQAV
ncbi:hypothetical protein EDB83DRAFT_2235914, partial [Lactarius deliciosus]